MKKYLLPLFALLLFTNQTNAQLTAHAGVDFGYCVNQNAGPWTGFATATGGTPPYTYAWSPASALSDSTLEHPEPTATVTTTYTVVVTDNLGATATDTIVVSVYRVPDVFFFLSDSFSCLGQQISFDGSACCGTPAYSYLWDFGDGNTSNLYNPQHTYAAPGNYTATFTTTDANGCIGTRDALINVGQVVATAIPTNPTCFGANNGIIQAFASGGNGNYWYAWSNGATTPFVTNLTAGIYTLTASDNYGCTATYTTVVGEPTQVVGNITTVNESGTGLCNGAATVLASGGTPPYTYNWGGNPPVTSINNMSNLCAGAYTITITDANACSATVTGSIITDTACNNSTLVAVIESQDLSCTHPEDTMRIIASGGTPPYTYAWSTGSTTQSFVNTWAGVYTAWVTDNAGCTRVVTDTVLNTGVVVSLVNNTPASCNGITNGALAVSVAGGIPPYTYAWNTTPAQTTDSLTNIPAGVYVLTVTDASSCTVVSDYIVNQGSTNWSYYVYVSSTLANCAINGTATALPQGGTPPYTYLWSNGDTTATITGLTSGSYLVTVTGADGCTRIGNGYVYTSCYNILQGQLINDLNGNCQQDSGETAYAYHTVVANSGSQNYYGYTDAQGYYTIQLPSGTFTITPYITGNCAAACSSQNASYTQTFPSLGDSVNNINFYLVQAPVDLYVAQSWGNFRPGFTRTVALYYGNAGTTLVNGTLTLNYDADLTFLSASNSGVHNATNHTVTWVVPNIPLTPYNNYYYQYYYNQYVSADFLTPVGTPVGTPIINTARINVVANECDSLNNIYVATTAVTNSMDPNKKEVSPAGDIFDETTSELTYTIHFQNTGNDTAWFIVLKDTLSSYLNAGSVKNIASSHPITDFNISGEGILTWTFNPIYLVDSATNPEGSQGYVTFTVKKKAGLPIGTQIKNTAFIYFDYNDAVVTNTVTTRLADPNSIYNVTNDAAINVTAAPNPFTHQTQLTVEGITGTFNFELFDVSGKLLKKIHALADNRFTINREGMSAGVYFYSITTAEKQKAFGRLVVE